MIPVTAHKKIKIWLRHGKHRAKLYSVEFTHDGEPVIFSPHRTGGHVTIHQSGVLHASDNHGFSRSDSWRPRHHDLKRAVESLCYEVPDDAMLVSIPSIDDGFIQELDSGDVILDLEDFIAKLTKITIHLTTRRLIREKGLEIGSRFFDLGRMAIIELIDSDGTAFGLPLDAEERGKLLSEIPVLGPFTDLAQAASDHAAELEAAGVIKPPKGSKALEGISAALEAQIVTADWSGVRFIDHVRGRIHRYVDGELEDKVYDH